MEGTYGLIIAIVLYFPIAPLLGENPPDAKSFSNNDVTGLAIGWTLLVTVTGIFNIAATAVTSSMTRNVWKNLRTLLVWIIGLIIFYASSSTDIGEGKSFRVLIVLSLRSKTHNTFLSSLVCSWVVLYSTGILRNVLWYLHLLREGLSRFINKPGYLINSILGTSYQDILFYLLYYNIKHKIQLSSLPFRNFWLRTTF